LHRALQGARCRDTPARQRGALNEQSGALRTLSLGLVRMLALGEQ
jgi:hypothetical protein